MTQPDSAKFTEAIPGTIACDEGWQVKLCLDYHVLYTEGERSMNIEIEFLELPAGFVLYTYSMQRWLPPFENELLDSAEKARIVDNIRRAYCSIGWEIHVY